MGEISLQTDCGNAPKKLFLKDLNVAFGNGDTDFLTNNISMEIKWEILGQIKVTGKEDYIKTVLQHKLWKTKELVIDTIITHGPDASVSGTVISANNSKYAFCDMYKFKGAGGTIIKSITTFHIKQ